MNSKKDIDTPQLSLRRVGMEDCRQLFDWVNDTSVRSASFSSSEINWDEHGRWFRAKLLEPGCFFCIAEFVGQKPVGQVRIDRGNAAWQIDISIARSWRGKGLGAILLRLAVETFAGEKGGVVVHAHVKEENRRSVKTFLKGGFKQLKEEVVKGHKVVHLIWRSHHG